MDERNPHQRAAFPACPLPFIPTALLCLLNQSPALSAPTGTHRQGDGTGFQFYTEKLLDRGGKAKTQPKHHPGCAGRKQGWGVERGMGVGRGLRLGGG